MKNNTFRVIRTLSLLTLVGTTFSCANLSTLQTARVQKVGESEMAIGGGYVTFPALTAALGSSTISSLPYFEGTMRRGFFERFDAGVKFTLIGTLAADAKYQLLDLGGFALAAGAGLGYITVTSGTTSSLNIVDLLVPVYISYDFNEWFSLYGSPKFVYRMILGTTSSSSYMAPILGATGGFRVGKRWGFMGEVSYGAGMTTGYGNTLQYNGAFFFKI